MTDEEMDHAGRAAFTALQALLLTFDADRVLCGSKNAPQLLLAAVVMMSDSLEKTGNAGLVEYEQTDVDAVRVRVKEHQSSVRAHNSRIEGSS